MSKIQRGNKEAKKPKQAPPATVVLQPGGIAPPTDKKPQYRTKKT